MDDVGLKIIARQSASDDIIDEFARDINTPLECQRFGFNPNKTHPYYYSLDKIDWSIVGTLTWKNERRRQYTFDAEKLRRIDYIHLLEKTCSTLNVRNNSYYHATEHGKAGEAHFHFLLWFKSGKVTPEMFAKVMEKFWRNQFYPFDNPQIKGGGMAIISPYESDRGSAAVTYCLKREFDERGQNRERFDNISDTLKKYLANVNSYRII